MRLIPIDSEDNLAYISANYIANVINEHNKENTKPFVLGLPTGGTPIKTYKELIRLYKIGKVSFQNVITFNMDEYFGLPSDHPESYRSFMYKHLFNHIDIKQENIHLLDGNANDYELECKKYEDAIIDAGGIDLFIGGIGNDGHIAFNEPGSSFKSRTRKVKLANDTILANSRFFEGIKDNVPNEALTIGIATLMDAKEILLLVTGLPKSYAVKAGIEKGINQNWPISYLQLHPNTIIMADYASCNELTLKTFNYHKNAEHDFIEQLSEQY